MRHLSAITGVCVMHDFIEINKMLTCVQHWIGVCFFNVNIRKTDKFYTLWYLHKSIFFNALVLIIYKWVNQYMSCTNGWSCSVPHNLCTCCIQFFFWRKIHFWKKIYSIYFFAFELFIIYLFCWMHNNNKTFVIM